MKPQSPECGFTLIEVMVAMVLLAVALLGLAPLTLQVGHLSNAATVSAQLAGALSGEASRLEATDFDDLTAGTTCTDYSAADFPRTHCVIVSDVDEMTKRVAVIVTALNGGPADTTVIQRSNVGNNNPLYQP
jgi:prepilin-type N-terminal cleavage/methylation domain-containing protein